jgi:indole-3-glycerol phosphate synthase
MDMLQEIMAERREDVARAKSAVPMSALQEAIRGRVHHSLVSALREGAGTRILAEMKRASPSAGLLRYQYQPAELADTYVQSGAAALSVLTEPRHFLGCEAHLREVRAAVKVPVLRKDFLCDAYQVFESAAWGADVVLLIVAALDGSQLRDLYQAAGACGLDVIAEAHTSREVDLAVQLENAIIGVNSRDLKTLKTDLSVARTLAARIPEGRLSIAESGIRTRQDIESLEALGYRGFLIGEALVVHNDPGKKLVSLLTPSVKAG